MIYHMTQRSSHQKVLPYQCSLKPVAPGACPAWHLLLESCKASHLGALYVLGLVLCRP